VNIAVLIRFHPFWICNDSLPVKTSTAYPVMWYAQSHSKVNSEFHHDMRHQKWENSPPAGQGAKGKMIYLTKI